MDVGIFETPPSDFQHDVHVTACLLQVENQVLSLQRAKHKFDPGKWELPGGKFQENEACDLCASRELFEETGIRHSSFQEIGLLYARRREGDFTLHMLLSSLEECPPISLSKEHDQYAWVTIEEMRALDLIHGQEVLINLYSRMSR